ncbi:helix-turn-helix domain-containing protein [Actinomadura sp. 21ATH]|uniref:helix-turn-helix domain-containing protein n=1 Tax=Actinomadura sp. 21ATH TaxID=1735444 RepID=UPI0035C2666D
MDDITLRETALVLLAQGIPLSEVNRRTGVPASTLSQWRSQSQRPDPRTRALCPRCHERDLDGKAYSYLLGLYLGDGNLANAPGDKGVYRLEIACCDSWPGLMEMAAVAVAAIMPGLQVGRRQKTGCTIVNAYSVHWPCLFPQHGPGRKHTRKIELAPWQRVIVDEYTEEFVRGLLHSDGWRGTNRVRRPGKDGDRWYEYPRYQFTNVSLDIQRLFTDALDRLGIPWKQMNKKNISVARREGVARLDEFVGPKH